MTAASSSRCAIVTSAIVSRKAFAHSVTWSTLPPMKYSMSAPAERLSASSASPSARTSPPMPGWRSYSRDEALDLAQERGEALAAVRLQLAGDQVDGLDVVGALVDREDLGVAAVLLDRDGP